MDTHFVKSKGISRLIRVLYDMTLSGSNTHSPLFCVLHLSVLATASCFGSLHLPSCSHLPACISGVLRMSSLFRANSSFKTNNNETPSPCAPAITSYNPEFTVPCFCLMPVSVDEFPWRYSEKGAWFSSNAGWRFRMKMATWVSGVILIKGWVSKGSSLADKDAHQAVIHMHPLASPLSPLSTGKLLFFLSRAHTFHWALCWWSLQRDDKTLAGSVYRGLGSLVEELEQIPKRKNNYMNV